MKLSFKKIGTTIAIAAALVFSAVGLAGIPAYAADPSDKVCEGIGLVFDNQTNSCKDASAIDNVWIMARDVINWILIAAGIIAVGFIIWAGIRYVLSGGDAEKVKKAKNTLLYAIIGLLIAALALVIVNLVISVGTTVTGTD